MTAAGAPTSSPTGVGATPVTRRAVLAGLAGLVAAPILGACGARGPDPIAADEPYYYDPRRLGVRRALDTDVCVYGATTGGVAAAVTAARLGHSTVLTAFGDHVGGMTTSGISTADVGVEGTIGGIAAEVYRRIGAAYGLSTSVYTYQPHVAASVLDGMLRAAGVRVLQAQPLRRVERQGNVLSELVAETGTTVRARQYVDASYEGDLLAAAGQACTAGREAAHRWGETLNGYRPAPPGAGFSRRVDAYRVAGRTSSGLLDGVAAPVARPAGSADPTPMAYGFRLGISDAADRIPFARPSDYRATDWDLAARAINAGEWDLLDFRVGLPGGGYDLNASGGVSTDAIGLGAPWAVADYAARQRLYAAHVAYTRGLLWFTGHDPRVPESIRKVMGTFGLTRGEWTTTGGWPPELYVREARRLLAEHVATQSDCTGTVSAPDPVALASYKIDSHPCQRMAVGGIATDEGTISYGVHPWGVSQRCLLPRRGSLRNLTVSTCVGSSHVAWSSLRMEPVFMMLGQAAASIASLAMAGTGNTHDVEYPALAALLLRNGAYLGAKT